MAHSVINPSVPSAPINNYFKSYPIGMASCGFILSIMVPSASTTFRPTQFACMEPYLMNLIPPAFVARLPPIWHDPLAPKSRGTM